MQKVKMVMLIFLISFGLVSGGCNLTPNNRTRPAPIRPTPTPKQKMAPTKNISGIDALSEKDLLKKVSQVEDAVKKGNWDTANRRTNELGADMARYRPNKDGKSLRDMSEFDLIYAKLQGNVKTKNKQACLKNTQNLRNELKDLKK